MPKTNYWIFVLSLMTTSLFGQYNLDGIIVDKKGNPLPFVNVLINNSQKNGVSTDIDGQFSIASNTPINQLTVSYLGYSTLELKAPFPNPFRIEMDAQAYNIEEITIVAGENPAHRIIRQVVKNRPLNDPEKMDSYACQTYNKMAFGYVLETEKMKAHYIKKDTSKKGIKKLYNHYSKEHEIFKKQELMLIETVSKRHFRKAHDLQEEVLLNRISGAKRLPLVALATQAQPFSFYTEEVILFDQAFLNPISKNSTNKYFFNLIDTVYQQKDTVFIIAFQPKKGKNFNGLEGQLHINTNQYAIQNVIASPVKKEYLMQFEIVQKYNWVNNQYWFPEQLLVEMETQPINISFAGLKMYGRTYISDVKVNPKLDKKLFAKGEEVVIKPDAYSRNDSLWQLYQKEKLSVKEKRTYRVIDSLFEARNLDKWVALIEFIGKERFTFGPLDMDITKLINGNPFQGLRLGLGLATNDKVSNWFEIGGYGVYGFRDKSWRYGGHFGLLFDKNRDNRLDFVYKKDLFVPAEPKFIQRGDILSFGQFANLREEMTYQGVHLQSYPFKYTRFNARLSQQTLSPLYDYQFGDEPTTAPFRFTEMQLGLRYAFNEKFVRFFGRRINNQSNFPILEGHYTKGFNDFLDGQWAYDKFLFSIHHTFRQKTLGKTQYRIEAGYINAVVPFSKLFSPFGLGTGYRSASLDISQGFQTMESYEFVADKFIHLFFKHDFGSLLLKSKKFKPDIVVQHNLAFGSLRQAAIHQNIEFKTLEKGFFEAGLILENLIRVKYLNFAYFGLGAGMYYRYGAYQNPNFSDNIAYGIKISISY